MVLFLCTGNYYRSRYAELCFNHRSGAIGAFSRGLRIPTDGRNPGPISVYVRERAAERKIPLPAPIPWPTDLTEADLRRASRVIALHEEEHRPLLDLRFPEWAERAEYWAVPDTHLEPPEVALLEVERQVEALFAQI